MASKYKIQRNRNGRRDVWRVSRWDDGHFSGGLMIKGGWSDPMFGSQCDFPDKMTALISLLEELNLHRIIELDD